MTTTSPETEKPKPPTYEQLRGMLESEKWISEQKGLRIAQLLDENLRLGDLLNRACARVDDLEEENARLRLTWSPPDDEVETGEGVTKSANAAFEDNDE